MTVPSLPVLPTRGRGGLSRTSITPLTAYQVAVLADSPVAWWHLGDAAGTAVDSVAGIDGTYTGSPAGAATLVVGGNGSHDFNGGQYVSIAGTAALKPTAVTVEAWVNVDGFTNSPRLFDLCLHRFFMDFDVPGHLIVTFYNGSVNRAVTSTAVLTPGVTYHVAGTFDNTTKVLTAYINGVVDGQATYAAQAISYAASTASAIGSESGGTASYDLNSRIDEVAVYATALSTARILAHYQAGI